MKKNLFFNSYTYILQKNFKFSSHKKYIFHFRNNVERTIQLYLHRTGYIVFEKHCQLKIKKTNKRMKIEQKLVIFLI